MKERLLHIITMSSVGVCDRSRRVGGGQDCHLLEKESKRRSVMDGQRG